MISMPLDDLLQLTIIINQRIEELKQAKDKMCLSIGELVLVNGASFSALPSAVIATLENAKTNIRNIDLEISTLNWVLKKMLKDED